MQTTTLDHYQRASTLRTQASSLLDGLELLAKYDVDRAEKLIYPAWERLSRRTAKVSEVAGQHWGAY